MGSINYNGQILMDERLLFCVYQVVVFINIIGLFFVQVMLMKERMIREFVFFYYLEGVIGIKNILNVNEIM